MRASFLRTLATVTAAGALCLGGLAFAVPAHAATVPTFTFNGNGYSHGVGMSQMGALQRAKSGESYSSILKAYFKSTSLSTRDELSSKKVTVALDRDKKSRSSWRVRAGSSSASFKATSSHTNDISVSDPKVYTFKVSSGKICMYDGTKKIKTFEGSSVTLTPTSGSPKLMEVYDTSGPFARNYILYRGTLRLTKSGSKLHLYNVVSVQEYLYGVVPREMGASYYKADMDASKVQAVCARSYAYRSIMNGDSLYCTTRSQVYGGYGRWSSSSRHAKYYYEESQSNKAVDQTKNKCVTYKGSVITTYFGSCNGSITANVEDVWGSSPRIYYTSVKDPKHTESSHSWTVKYDGYALAKVLKSKGASVPSGAGTSVWVDKLTPTYGKYDTNNNGIKDTSNGWVTSLKVTWSNGSSTTLSHGDTIRVRMGFKSARFTISTYRPAPPAPDPAKPAKPSASVKRIQETNHAIRRSGSWGVYTLKSGSGGYHASTKTLNDYALFKFKGEGITWVGSKTPDYGQAIVYVDDAYKTTINLKSTKTLRKQNIYTIKGLDKSKTHTLKIVNSTKSGSKSAGYMDIDAADLINASPVEFSSKTYQETSSYIKHGSWSKTSHKSYSGDKAYITKSRNKTVSFKVKAQGFKIYSKQSSKGGRFKVYVDGSYKTTVNLKKSTTKRGVKVYDRYRLNPAKSHTVKLVTTTASKSSKGGEVVLDRVVTYDGVLVK